MMAREECPNNKPRIRPGLKGFKHEFTFSLPDKDRLASRQLCPVNRLPFDLRSRPPHATACVVFGRTCGKAAVARLESAAEHSVFAVKHALDEFPLIMKNVRSNVELTQSRDILPRVHTHSRDSLPRVLTHSREKVCATCHDRVELAVALKLNLPGSGVQNL
jgi:hypothetical protein